jgi:hypothetical protein
VDAGPEEAGEIEGRDAGRGTRPLGDPGRPVGINNGANGAASLANPLTSFCVLHGTHAPFDADKLASLYPVAVVKEAVNAGVWVYGAGRKGERASIVGTDGMVTDGPFAETKEVIGGFSVVDVPSREEALEWAAKIAVACRCAQEVRELLPDPPGLEQSVPQAQVGAST